MPRRNDQEKKADAEGAKRRRDEKKKLAQRAKVSDTAMVSAHVRRFVVRAQDPGHANDEAAQAARVTRDKERAANTAAKRRCALLARQEADYELLEKDHEFWLRACVLGHALKR